MATHYSERYETADDYLENFMNDYDTYAHISYLRTRSPESVVDDFFDKFLTVGNTVLKWKHMQYLWNAYLEQNRLPGIMYLSDLKLYLMERVKYDAEQDAFVGITSRHLPEINRFLRFWETSMQVSSGEQESEEYEMSELCSLYTKWAIDNNYTSMREKHVSEKKLVGLVDFYFPGALDPTKKFVRGFSHVFWSKRKDVLVALELYRANLIRSGEYQTRKHTCVSIYEMYLWYCNNNEKGKINVGKPYFEKILLDELSKYISPGTKKVSMDWVLGL